MLSQDPKALRSLAIEQPFEMIRVALARAGDLTNGGLGKLPQRGDRFGARQKIRQYPMEVVGIVDLDPAPANEHLHAVVEILHMRAEEHRSPLRRGLEEGQLRDAKNSRAAQAHRRRAVQRAVKRDLRLLVVGDAGPIERSVPEEVGEHRCGPVLRTRA